MSKTHITITLHLSEILYDAANKTYLTGRSRSTGQNYEEVSHMQAEGDEEDRNHILRSIGDAYATLKIKLSEYMRSCATSSSNSLIDESGDLLLHLDMPANYNNVTVDTIRSAANAYIVNMAIAEWFNITNKTDAEDYLTKAAGSLEQIREALNKRERPVRIMLDADDYIYDNE